MKNINGKKSNSILAYPYVIWSILFIVVPLFIVLYFSFTEMVGFDYVFSLKQYRRLLNPQYGKILIRSLKLALTSTLLCLVIGYPVAYIISKMKSSKRGLLIMLFIVPMWMNFLLRTYAWLPILGKNGLVNNILGSFGLGPYELLYNEGTVLLGMVYNFLPFMILPIYTILDKMDSDVIAAAEDLGANRFHIFYKIIFPLSLPGVMSGITMVFMPAVSTFIISNLLGGGNQKLIGNLIEQQFTSSSNWNFGSAISIIMMIVILISMSIMNKFSDSDKEGGAAVW